MTQTTKIFKPWNDGERQAILEWHMQWMGEEKHPETVNLTATHFERLLEGACYEIQR